jgi:TP901 family phage tail tape measure protein
MAGNGLDLVGRVSINTLGATNSIKRLATAFKDLDVASKVGLGVSEKTARAFAEAAAAASTEKAAVANLARAQSGLNKELAQTAVLQERANATKRTSLASAFATRATGKERIARAGAVTSDAAGRAALNSQRALTEEVRRTILADDAAGRAAQRSAQMRSLALRDSIAEQRLASSQSRAAEAAAARSTVSAERAAQAFGHIGSAAAHVGVTAGAVFAGIIANAVVMDRQFASIVRTSDIADMPTDTVAQLKAQASAVGTLKGQFDALAQALPISYKELTEIGAAANQLGIQRGQLANFTQAVAQFSATTGVSVDTASTAFGRLDSLVIDVVRHGKTIKGSGVDHDFVGLADAINKVGVNSVATDQQIINIASQIAGIANTAGLGYKEIVGFSGALASVGTQPFLARGLTTRLFTNIIDAVSEGGKKLDAFAKVSGLTSQQFAEQWSNNPGQTLIKLMHGVAASGTDAVKVLKSIGVTSILDQPALLRLSRAADSNGTAFGLLAQTMRDANDAAGENARQYAIIAGTVQARLQVALNRTQIALRQVAESDLGPLTDGINNVSFGILKFSQGLDKSFKLFGLFDTGIKNSALFGTALLGVGAIAAIALLTAGGAKLVATFIRLQEAASFVRQNVAKLGTALEPYIDGTRRAEAATNRLAAASARATAARSAGVVGTSPTLDRVSGGIGGTTALMSRYAATTDRALASSNKLVRGIGALGSLGAGGIAKAQAGLSRFAGAARTAGSAVSNLVGGPLGLIALGALAASSAYSGLIASMQKIGTNAGDASLGILKATNAMQTLASIKISNQDPVSALFSKSTVSLDKVVGSTQKFGKSLEALGSGGFIDDFGAKIGNIFNRSNTDFNTLTAGLDKIDDGFQNLSDSGNLDGAVKGIQNLFRGQSDAAVINGLAHMDSATAILTQKLQAEGKTVGENNKNLIAAARSNDVFSAKQARTANALDATTKAFAGNEEAAKAFTDAAQKAGLAATDLNSAYSQVSKKGPASFGAFIKQADDNYKTFVTSQENAVKIAQDTGADLTRLSALDPHILSGAIASGKKGEKELARVLALQDAVASFNAAMAQLGNDPALYQRFAALGTNAKAAFLKTLHGGGSLEEAFTVTLKLDTQKAIATAEATGNKFDAIRATMQLAADPATAIKAGQSAKDYVDGLKAEFPIFGNNLPAYKSGESAKAYIDRLRGTMTAGADTDPGIAKATKLRNYINSLKGNVFASANTAAAEAALDRLSRPRTATVYVNTVGGGNGATFSDSRDSRKGGRATGGWIDGPGTATSDSIPINVSKGEYIVRAAAARQNAKLLESINGPSPYNKTNKYASGGFVQADNYYKSAHYEGTYTSRRSAENARGPVIQVTELSAYDRHLLVSIQEAVGVTVTTETVSRANRAGNQRQSNRGNG